MFSGEEPSYFTPELSLATGVEGNFLGHVDEVVVHCVVDEVVVHFVVFESLSEVISSSVGIFSMTSRDLKNPEDNLQGGIDGLSLLFSVDESKGGTCKSLSSMKASTSPLLSFI